MTEHRTDYPRKVTIAKSGKEIVREASYQIDFVESGRRIAFYSSKLGYLYLNTDYLASRSLDEMKKPYSERIKGSKYEKQYAELLKRYSRVSEYRPLRLSKTGF